MEPLPGERRVIEAAEALARTLGDDPNHTVAAAAMDLHGHLHTGVNVYHFTGGPCAELVVLGVAAATQGGPLLTMAAAGDRGRGLLPPCGRCRQAMLDLHPDLLVALPGPGGPVMRPIRKLLPDGYHFPHASAHRIVRFNQRYYDAVRTGRKTVTIRWDDTPALGPATFVFEDHPDHAVLSGEVLSVQRCPLATLDAQQARLTPGDDLAALKTGLSGHYPDMPPDATIEVVSFRTVDPATAIAAEDRLRR